MLCLLAAPSAQAVMISKTTTTYENGTNARFFYERIKFVKGFSACINYARSKNLLNYLFGVTNICAQEVQHSTRSCDAIPQWLATEPQFPSLDLKALPTFPHPWPSRGAPCRPRRRRGGVSHLEKDSLHYSVRLALTLPSCPYPRKEGLKGSG